MKLETMPVETLIEKCLQTFRETFPAMKKTDGLMLAGGRTPLEIYRRAAGENLTTAGVLFLSDERYVSAGAPQSNYGTIAPYFPQLMKIPVELPIEEAAKQFDRTLHSIQQIPFGLLGLGADGHTASLFNLNDASLRDERLAIPVIKTQKPDRISVTPALLHRIEKIIILAAGDEKRETIKTLMTQPQTIPAGVALANHPDVEIWFCENSHPQ